MGVVQIITAIAIVASAAAPCLAGACIAVNRDRILISDLAKALPSFAAAPQQEPIGFAPLPGAQRILRREELARLAARYSVPDQSTEALCFALEVAPLTTAAIAEAMRDALGLAEGAGEIVVVDYPRQPMPRGRIMFSTASAVQSDRPDGSRLVRGRVLYGDQRSASIWARVQVQVDAVRLVAAMDLKAGAPIAPDQVRFETVKAWPGAAPAAQVNVIAGRAPRRTIPAGAAIDPNMLILPKEVAAGDVVEVEVTSGAARLRFPAKASTPGRRGDSIVLINSSSGARFTGRIEGPGKASVRVTSTITGSNLKDTAK
jgi:flagella basal body P-ring formation protein FlgA